MHDDGFSKMKEMLKKFMDKKPGDYFPTNSSQSKAFSELKKACGGPSVTAQNRKWTQLFMADKLALLMVLGTQRPKIARASVRGGTAPMNELKRAFAELKRVFNPCHSLYLEEVQRLANMKHRTPSLSCQNNGKRVQDLYPFRPSKKDSAACPIPGCGHKSTMACGSHADANKTNATNRERAFEDGGDGKFNGVSTTHGCYCFAQEYHGNDFGVGCWYCVALVEKNGRAPGTGAKVCQFDCNICTTIRNGKKVAGCTCQATFDRHRRQMIGLSLKKTADQEAKKAGVRTQLPAQSASEVYHNFLHDT